MTEVYEAGGSDDRNVCVAVMCPAFKQLDSGVLPASLDRVDRGGLDIQEIGELTLSQASVLAGVDQLTQEVFTDWTGFHRWQVG